MGVQIAPKESKFYLSTRSTSRYIVVPYVYLKSKASSHTIDTWIRLTLTIRSSRRLMEPKSQNTELVALYYDELNSYTKLVV